MRGRMTWGVRLLTGLILRTNERSTFNAAVRRGPQDTVRVHLRLTGMEVPEAHAGRPLQLNLDLVDAQAFHERLGHVIAELTGDEPIRLNNSPRSSL